MESCQFISTKTEIKTVLQPTFWLCAKTLSDQNCLGYSKRRNGAFTIPWCKNRPNDLSIPCRRIQESFLHFEFVWDRSFIGPAAREGHIRSCNNVRYHFPTRLAKLCVRVSTRARWKRSNFWTFLSKAWFHKNRPVVHGANWNFQDSLDTINTPQNSPFKMCRTSKKSIFGWAKVEYSTP